MKYWRYCSNISMAVISVLLLSLGTVQAQNIRCDLVPTDCINLQDNQPISVQVPWNTTRLQKEDFQVCAAPEVTQVTADVIFAVDQSTSMNNNDNNFQAPQATAVAINLLEQLSPNSRAGYMAFGNGLCDGTTTLPGNGAGARDTVHPNTIQPPVPLADAAQKALLLQQTDYNSTNYYYGCGSDDDSGTEYWNAFKKAKEWADDPALTPSELNAIIFLTDGAMTRNQEQFAELLGVSDSTNFPEVYAIFIGRAGNQAADLIEFTEKTGGQFYNIQNASEIEEVMTDIIQSSVIQNRPVQSNIANNTNGASALSGDMIKVNGTENHYMADLQNEIALNINANQLVVSTAITEGSVASLTKNIMVDASGPEIKEVGKTPIEGTPFEVNCVEAAKLTFVDTENAPITVIEYPTNSFGVILTPMQSTGDAVVSITSAGDTEALPLEGRGQTQSGTIGFNYGTANPGDGKVDGAANQNVTATWAHTFDPRDVATATIPVMNNVPEKAWITDENKDGRADRITIQYTQPLQSQFIPLLVEQIKWPNNTVGGRVVNHVSSDPAISPIKIDPSDDQLLIVDISANPYPFGMTEGSTELPPSLVVNGVEVLIEDRVGPVLVSAVKLPSNFKRYADMNDEIQTMPDTLVIHLSESIQPIPNKDRPWEELLSFYPEGDTSQPAIPLMVLAQPIATPGDPLTYRVLIENDIFDSTTLKVGDKVFLTPDADYVDLVGNQPESGNQKATGSNGEIHTFKARNRTDVAGSLDDASSVNFDESLPKLDSNFQIVDVIYAPEIKEWVPPVGFRPDGTIDTTICTEEDTRESCEFPSFCLSSLSVQTEPEDGPYVAHVIIYDHFGNYINSSIQKFGYCGELANVNRKSNQNIINDLIWNQKDHTGKSVGSGVYIWHVHFAFESGSILSVWSKQGYVNNQTNCTVIPVCE